MGLHDITFILLPNSVFHFSRRHEHGTGSDLCAALRHAVFRADAGDEHVRHGLGFGGKSGLRGGPGRGSDEKSGLPEAHLKTCLHDRTPTAPTGVDFV